LAEELAHFKSKPDVVVFGLARGGVAVAAEVASALSAPLDLKDHTAILVNDGLATGSTMLAAVDFARKRLAKWIVMAVPVASVEALGRLRRKVDECICLATPEPFFSVADWYWNFLPTEDAEVLKLLEESAHRNAASAPV